jgi:hypothetical protein
MHALGGKITRLGWEAKVLRVLLLIIAFAAAGCTTQLAEQACGSVYAGPDPAAVLRCKIANLDSRPGLLRSFDSDLYRTMWMQQLVVVERWKRREITETDARAQMAALESQAETQIQQRQTARDSARAARDAADAAQKAQQPKRTQCINTGVGIVHCTTQ